MKSKMKFSWRALVVAPAVIPFIVSTLMVIANHGKSLLASFAFLFVLSSMISYSTTIFVFLPCLYLLSKLSTPRYSWVCLLGIVLGVAILLPVDWVCYQESGMDSGPPQGTFYEYLWRNWWDPVDWVFPVGGLITAMVYWFLVNRFDQRNEVR